MSSDSMEDIARDGHGAQDVHYNELPSPPISADELKAVWSRSRTIYTDAFGRFTQSGQLAHGTSRAGDGDTEFREHFVHNDLLMWFMYLLYGRTLPPIASRANPAAVCKEIGVTSPTAELIDAGPSSKGRPKKRQSNESSDGLREMVDIFKKERQDEAETKEVVSSWVTNKDKRERAEFKVRSLSTAISALPPGPARSALEETLLSLVTAIAQDEIC